MTWREKALCASRSDINWFPVYEDHRGDLRSWRANLEAAKELCASCEVAPQCLAAALADPYTAGIWAGTTESERRGRWQQPKRVARCATDSGYSQHIREGTEPCRGCRDAHAMAARLRKMRLAVVQ